MEIGDCAKVAQSTTAGPLGESAICKLAGIALGSLAQR
jgi:hypothetical protein